MKPLVGEFQKAVADAEEGGGKFLMVMCVRAKSSISLLTMMRDRSALRACIVGESCRRIFGGQRARKNYSWVPLKFLLFLVISSHFHSAQRTPSWVFRLQMKFLAPWSHECHLHHKHHHAKMQPSLPESIFLVSS